MIRTILIVLYLVIFFIIGIPLSLVEAILGRIDTSKRERFAFRYICWGCSCIRFLSGMQLTMIGYEKVPKDTAVLYVANHRSFFDVIALFPYLNNTTGFVAKKELLKIPFLRQWMKYVNCEFLDRDNIKQGLKTILSCIATVKRGCSMFIFPEGTRSSGTELLEFKGGSFKIAEKSGCLIVPIAIANTDDVFENHKPYVRKTQVTIEFGDPIDIKALPKEEQRQIGTRVQALVAGMLEKNHKTLGF